VNPFKDWKPDQQCRVFYAETIFGIPVEPTSRLALRTCASGRLHQLRIPESEIMEFALFQIRRFGEQTINLNDKCGWMPHQFAAAWDQFEAERTQ